MSRNHNRRGRTTPKGTAGPGSRRPPPYDATDRRPADPAPSARYTPPGQDVTVRPGWNRVAGWIGVAVGLLIAILNDAMLLGTDLVLLPFGHSELYLLAGVGVAGWSTRWLGLFDQQTVYL